MYLKHYVYKIASSYVITFDVQVQLYQHAVVVLVVFFPMCIGFYNKSKEMTNNNLFCNLTSVEST